MLLVGGAAYKLGQNSVKQIEDYTGKPADELSEQELEAAMDHLGIEEEEVTDADMAAIEAQSLADEPAPAAAPAPVAAPAPAAAPAAAPDYIEELRRLAELRDAGIVTDAEFEAKKKQLLGL
jgi:predicted Zn-dependent peptidase